MIFQTLRATQSVDPDINHLLWPKSAHTSNSRLAAWRLPASASFLLATIPITEGSVLLSAWKAPAFSGIAA